jgi:ankyrin repeat protein
MNQSQPTSSKEEDDNCPTIHIAAQHGNDAAVLSFIERKADLNSKLAVS